MQRTTVNVSDQAGQVLQLSHVSEDNGMNAGGHAEGIGIQIRWQQGSLKEAGRNGAFLEDLIVIAKDQLEFFQNGPFPCTENAVAIEHLKSAITIMLKRREDRQKREVEGLQIP